MKRNLHRVLAILLFLLPACSFAQLDLKLNIEETLRKKPSFSIDMGADKLSLEFINSFNFRRWITTADELGNEIDVGPKRFAYTATLRANKYFNPKKSIDGWFVSPAVNFMRQTIYFEQPTLNTRLGGYVVVGRKGMIGDSRFGYQVEGGLGYWFLNKTVIKATGGITPLDEAFPGLLSFLKKFQSIQVPFNISAYYRIGEN
jgi:hypothetical protein